MSKFLTLLLFYQTINIFFVNIKNKFYVIPHSPMETYRNRAGMPEKSYGGNLTLSLNDKNALKNSRAVLWSGK